jgi:transposase
MAHSGNEVKAKRGRPPKLSREQVGVVREVALANRAATVEELRKLVEARTSVSVNRDSMYKYLAAAGVKRLPRAPRTRPSAGSTTTSSAAPSVPASPPRSYGYTKRHRDPGNGSRYPAGLTDPEWSLVGDLFEGKGPGKPPKYPRRRILDACCYVVRSGCAWRMLPKDFPPWQSVYAHFRRWATKELFERMHDRLRSMWRARVEREPAPTAGVIDSQSVKTSPQGGPKGFDAGKKVKGRKRHLLVDTLGLLLAVIVHPANIQDRDGAAPVVAAARKKYPSLKKLFVDCGYNGRCAEALRATFGLDVEIVRRPHPAGAWTDAQLALFTPPPPSGFVLLPKRWVVERTNSWVERPRRLAKDHDRRLDVAEAWVWFAEGRRLLRNLGAAA